MCGINGFSWSDSNLIQSMNDAISHRGPDNSGIYSDFNCTLGHVRLSILDTSERGNQPMFFYKKNYVNIDKSNSLFDYALVFNGEIYNFVELKKKLKNYGYNFKTKSDSEVILAAYDYYGESCVSHFNGMFSFCIYDKLKSLFFISRDRLGQKPLYYNNDNSNFSFSSDISGLYQIFKNDSNNKLNINHDALNLFFSNGFIPSPYSIFNGINKLEPGFNLIYNLKTKTLTKTRYYEIPKYTPKKITSSELIAKIKKSIMIRLRSDVGIGFFLSGGIDSSGILGIVSKNKMVRKVKSISMSFDGNYDESKNIKTLNNHFNIESEIIKFNYDDIQKLIDEVPKCYAEPFADQSIFPTMKICKHAKKYSKVFISGDGGDELFGGYPKHRAALYRYYFDSPPQFIRDIIKVPIKLFLKIIHREEIYNLLYIKPYMFEFINSENKFIPPITKAWFKNSFLNLSSKMPFVEAVIKHDLFYKTLPDNFLVKVDRASMFYGLEVRSPFLDYKLVELSSSIDFKKKLNIIFGKKILRKSLISYVPKRILNDNVKSGFTPPFREWLGHQNIDYLLIQKELEKNKLLTPELVSFFGKNKLNWNMKIRLFIYYKWVKYWRKKIKF